MLNALQGQSFRQKVKLIELTKQLEREPCDSLSFTHKLTRGFQYSHIAEPDVQIVNEDPSYYVGGIEGDIDYFYTTPFSGGIPLYSIRFVNGNSDVFIQKELSTDIYEGWFDGNQVTGQPIYHRVEGNQPETGTYRTTALYEDDGVTPIPDGKLTIKYYIYYYNIESFNYTAYNVFYQIEKKPSDQSLKPIPSITDVINRILDVGQPRPLYKAPKYKLRKAIADKFADVPAPEFFFPRMTKFEALLEVGKKIHGIPRLIVDQDEESETYGEMVVTYDLLGLDEEYRLPDTAVIVGYKNLHGAEDFCGGLDSYVDNHINTVDPNAGTVTEPFAGGFKTLRCEGGVKITNSTAVFEFDRPIYRAVKLEMAFTSLRTGTVVGDITKYLFEQAEYDGLFAQDSIGYPYSIAYALVYRQGDRYIRGFNTTSSAILNIIQQFKSPAINNIVIDKLGGDQITLNEIYANLAFRLTYIPMDSLRLRQYKPYATEDQPPRDNLVYNQQNANTVEASYYGSNLKGKIARMGNEIDVYTVRFRSYDDLPKIGNLLVDIDETNPNPVQGYIYKITTAKAQTFIKADIYVTQDFNRLSEYFSLESNFRLFEVSERQSIDRQVTVPRVMKVSLTPPTWANGTEKTLFERRAITKQGGIIRFLDTFQQSLTAQRSRPTVSVLKLLGQQNNSYEQIGDRCFALPVNSTACGNSLAFSFSFKDSYSAGKRSEDGGTDTDTGISERIKWKQQKDSPYGDIFGSFYAMEFGISDTIYDLDNGNYTAYEPTYDDQSTAGGFCDSLPTLKSEDQYEGTVDRSYLSTGYITDQYSGQIANCVRVIDKNSSEHISVVVQLHGQATDKRIVFGTAMWNNNLLIRDEPVKVLDEDGNPTNINRQPPHVYGLIGKRLNMLRDRIDLSDTAHVVDFGNVQTVSVQPTVDGTTLYGVGRINAVTLPANAPEGITAWCIADSVYGDIYIGVNESVAPSGSTSPIYFAFDEEA